MDLRVRLGLRIQNFRRKKLMTQQGLAVAAGMTRPHISLIEAGKINVTIKKIEAICRALGIHPDQLFETVKLDL